jgi:transposase InsO family protein
MTVPDSSPDTKPSVLAAVVMLALAILRDRGLEGWPRTDAEAIALLGAGRSQAYEMLGRLEDAIGTLCGQPGRPAHQEPSPDAAAAITRAVRDFAFAHPGAVKTGGARSCYSDAFRRFVLDLRAPGAIGHELAREPFANAVGIPPDTLDDWLRHPPATQPAPSPPPPEGPDVAQAHLATILAQWPDWTGTFKAFCASLREQHRIPYGDTFIGTVLHAVGLRQRQPRRTVEAPWSPGTFRTLFPGAHWIGDGTTIAFWINGHPYFFNAQPVVDAASNAIVAFDVTDAEDQQAVIDAHQHGIQTAGAPPLALTLDNRPSNLTPEVEQAIAPTILVAATPGRGQAKAPTEGTIGLFAQTAPPLAIGGRTKREIARSGLQLALTVFAWARNGKPRRRLGGRTPRDVYLDANPTPEDIEAALDWIRELQRRQERARLTREARLDPVRLELLARGFEQIGIADPDGCIARQLATYSRDAIAYGLATYLAKQREGSIPTDAIPHRYLGGIIRNRHESRQLALTGLYLLEQRLLLRDLALGPLEVQAERIRESLPAVQLPHEFVDQALRAGPTIDFRFWMTLAAKAIASRPPAIGRALYSELCRRIAGSFSTDRDRRADLIDALAAAITATT